MRIALVSEHASPLAAVGGVDAGGQNVHVAALADALVDRGHAVSVYTRRDDPAPPRVVTPRSGLAVVHLPAGPARPVPKDELFPHMAEFGDALRRSLAAEAPHVVHAHFWMSGMAGLAAARPLGLPVVQTFHALGVIKRRHQRAADTSPPQRASVEPAVATRADRIIATCSDEVFELVRLGVPASRIDVVPCGVDTGRFRPDAEAAPRRSRPRLLTVARPVPRKGVDDVIRALPRLPGVELVVAGGEPGGDAHARRLRRVAAGCGVADRVLLLGAVPRERMPALYRSADLVVVSPWYEPFGIVPLEAMACGVPVVASAVGGLVDTVVDGRTGAHVPPRDPAAIAEAVRALLAAPRLRAELGQAGVARARGRYTWPRVAAATEATYRRLARARRSAAVGARR